MRKLADDCWVCQNLRTPENLILRETPTTIAKLNPDQLFRGYTFLILKWHEEDLHTLNRRDQKNFLADLTKTSRALKNSLKPDRLNHELLGNAQPHLHWHIIPRYKTDPMWGRPIWAGNRPRKRLTQDAYISLVKTIQAHLPHKATD